MVDDLTPDASVSAPTGRTGRTKPEKVKRQRGPSRTTALLVGLILGVVGTLMVPDLFPKGEPNCERPARVEWSQGDGGAVSLTVESDGTGGNVCAANIVFSEQTDATAR